jgi:hypothetical protein
MEDLFRSYWWLIFPIWGLAMGSWHSFANYRRQRATLEVIRTYAQKGETPPAALLAALGDTTDAGYGAARRQSPAHFWSLTGLFLVMAVGFGVAGYSYGFEGVGWPFGVVALVMGAVAVWALINALLFGRQPRS